jgi:hypothetical protein
MKLTFTVPIKATFTLNSREHWSARARKRKAERQHIALAMKAVTVPMFFAPGFLVTLTRIGPRKLDSDNVQGALKAIRDEVAAQLGIDDGDPRITWNYEQSKGDYAVKVVIETAEAEAA